jgi:tRNA G26 N,N-dimethylase Trm1
MTYLHCPRCRLAVRCRASYLAFTNCPRCIARAAIVSPMFSSPLDGAQLREAGADRQHAPRAPAVAAAVARTAAARPTRPPPTVGA